MRQRLCLLGILMLQHELSTTKLELDLLFKEWFCHIEINTSGHNLERIMEGKKVVY